jgi:hypothetical protein
VILCAENRQGPDLYSSEESVMDNQIGTGQTSTLPTIQPHNERAASVWSSGGRDYEEIIRGVYDGIDTTVARLNPHPG